MTYLSQIIFLPGNGDGTFGAEINSSISTTEQAGAASGQPPAGNAVVTDADLDGALDLVFGSGAVALGDGKGDFSAGTPVVEVAIPSIPTAFNYFNIASLGTFQPTGSAYPDLVFAAPSGVGSAPFPLVAISTSSAFAVQSDGGAPSVTVTSGQSRSVPLSVTGAATYTGSVTLTCTGLPSKCFVHLQSRHTQPCRRHAPIVDSDRFHGCRQHGRHGQTLPGARHDNVRLRHLCRQSAATLAETPSRLLDDPCARRLHFAAVGLWRQRIIDFEVEHACRHIYLPVDCDGRNDAEHNQLYPYCEIGW